MLPNSWFYHGKPFKVTEFESLKFRDSKGKNANANLMHDVGLHKSLVASSKPIEYKRGRNLPRY